MRGCEREQVHLRAGSRRKDALLREWTKDSALSQLLLWQTKLFVVNEEERLVFAVKNFRDHDWATDSPAILVQQDSVLWSFTEIRRGQGFIVEVIVRGEVWLTVVPVEAATEVICATARHKLDLHCAIACAFRSGRRGGNCYFTNRVDARSHEGEETVIGTDQIVLHVDTVERDVERAFRQAVYGRSAR